MASRLLLEVKATAIAGGTARFVFPGTPASNVQTGTCFVRNAPLTAAFEAQVGSSGGGFPWGAWTGNGTFGPVQAWGAESLVIAATGLTPGTEYVAVWIGLIERDFEATPVSPTALATSVTNASPSSGVFVGAIAAKIASQNLPNGASTAVTFPSVTIDTDSYTNAGTPATFTIPSSKVGKYLLTWTMYWLNGGAGGGTNIQVILRKNGSFIIPGLTYMPASALAVNESNSRPGSALVVAAAADVFELVFINGLGSDCTGFAGCAFGLEYVGA